MHTQSRFGACTDQSALTRCRDGTHKSLDELRLLRHASEAKPRRTRHAAPVHQGGAGRRPLGASSQPAPPVTVSSITLFYRVMPTLKSVVWVQSAVRRGSFRNPQSRRPRAAPLPAHGPAQLPGQASREQWPSLITSSRSSTSYSPAAYCTLQHRTMGRGTAGQGMRSERLRPGGHHR